MNASSSPRTVDGDLPALSDATIARLEDDIFADIQRRRGDERARGVRRRRGWLGAGAAAGVLVIAAVIAPSVVGGIQGSASDEAAVSTPGDAGMFSGDRSDSGGGAADMATGESAVAPVDPATATTDEGGREIIANGSVSLTVDDIETAAEEIGDAATAAGGYVESMDIGSTGTSSEGAVDDMSGGVSSDSVMYPGYPLPGSYGWISIRVPASDLTSFMADLDGFGTVTSSSVSRQDVTTQTVDLRARISAAEASVARLTELMQQAASLADLLAAESALAERQATLESYQQQLTLLEDQVSMSGLTVQLSLEREVVEANPAGFGDGLATGWNALVATLNGIVVALGFLIPWIVIVVLIGAVAWAVVAGRRRRHRSAPVVLDSKDNDE